MGDPGRGRTSRFLIVILAGQHYISHTTSSLLLPGFDVERRGFESTLHLQHNSAHECPSLISNTDASFFSRWSYFLILGEGGTSGCLTSYNYPCHDYISTPAPVYLLLFPKTRSLSLGTLPCFHHPSCSSLRFHAPFSISLSHSFCTYIVLSLLISGVGEGAAFVVLGWMWLVDKDGDWRSRWTFITPPSFVTACGTLSILYRLL